MKAGRDSKTATLVCMGRALAHLDASLPAFSDPTALTLLPERARRFVEQTHAGTVPKHFWSRAQRGYLVRQSKIMVARTLAIDDQVRDAGNPQLVILGAGLDGRAWRLPELAGTLVFEVDHPDSQRVKRQRTAPLTATAAELSFVPVDFARDDLGGALAGAGHDRGRPTTWIWEGVVMYLTQPAIEATLSVIGNRSARGSRILVLYHSPALILRVAGLIVRYLGEPLRSSFHPEQMRQLLEAHGLQVVRDQDVAEIGRTVSPEVAQATRVVKHLRLVTAVVR